MYQFVEGHSLCVLLSSLLLWWLRRWCIFLLVCSGHENTVDLDLV